VDVDVHGGLTFGSLEPCTEHADGQGWWFGFDCAHFQDCPYDPAARLEELSPEGRSWVLAMRGMRSGHYWTQTEVEAECEQLAQQLTHLK
jgi:hypothetical protein